MKNLKLLSLALCLLCTSVQAVVAQENGNRDENNKIVRGPYMTNEAGANWWINLGGGITVFGDGGCTPRVTPALDFSFGKWFTPSIGFRLGYQGLTGSMWTPNQVFSSELDADKNLYKSKFGYAYAHGDFMWNISNAFSGYKETRFWNVIPYLHAGMLVAYKNGAADKEFAAGAGLYNTLRLCDRVDLTLDVRGLLVNGRQFQSAGVAGELSATLGIAVNLGKTNWSRDSKETAADESTLARISELELANQTLAAEKEELTAAQKELAAANEQLKDENEELSKPVSQQEELAKIIPHSFYFGIGKTQLSKTELSHLDFYLSNINSRISEGMTVVLTVRADASTGSQERNEFLNEARINYIKDLLQNKYNLRVDGYELHHEIVKSENPALDRAVEIRFK